MIAAALTDAPLGAPSVVSFSDQTSTGTLSRTAGVIFKSDGLLSIYRHGVPIDHSYWITPPTNMGDYEIYATVLSGTTPDGSAVSSWLALDTTREWTLTYVAGPTVTCSLQLEVRWTGNNVVQDTATFTITSSA